MNRLYYQDDYVSLYHGDCLTIPEWLTADVLITDPPYGIGWKRGRNHGRSTLPHRGIANDQDTAARDAALAVWGSRPAVLFGSLIAPLPARLRQVLVWHKPPDAGVYGSTTGYRRDLEAVYLCGDWPVRSIARSALLRSGVSNVGNPSSPAGRTGHPHAKPTDLMVQLIGDAPGGVVADPFAGSGSTLVAAKLLGRRAIGVEIDERYCEVAAGRLSQEVFDGGPR